MSGNVKKETQVGKAMASRLEYVIKEVLCTSYRKIEQATNINNLRRMAIGEAGITDKTLIALERFTNINVEWLKTGEGEPLKDNTKNNQEGMKPRILNYGTKGTEDGSLESFVDEFMPTIKQFPNYDGTIVFHGRSMEPTYHAGDELAIRNITKSSFRQWGAPHVLNTSQGIIIRRIFSDEKGYKCVSDNHGYEPFVVPEDEVYGVYSIVGYIHTEG